MTVTVLSPGSGAMAFFSVSQSGVGAVVRYIAQQQEHHRRFSFADEYHRLLDLYKVDYDDRFLLCD